MTSTTAPESTVYRITHTKGRPTFGYIGLDGEKHEGFARKYDAVDREAAERTVECPSCGAARIVWPNETSAPCDSCGRDVLDVEPARPLTNAEAKAALAVEAEPLADGFVLDPAILADPQALKVAAQVEMLAVRQWVADGSTPPRPATPYRDALADIAAGRKANGGRTPKVATDGTKAPRKMAVTDAQVVDLVAAYLADHPDTTSQVPISTALAEAGHKIGYQRVRAALHHLRPALPMPAGFVVPPSWSIVTEAAA